MPSATPDRAADLALARFHEITGQRATHLSYAPGRANLIGEHTDYSGGFVLPFAIDLGIYVAARRRPDRRVRVSSAQVDDAAEFALDSRIAPEPGSWSNYVRGVLAGFQEAGIELPGFDATIYATLPRGGGLSSSAALEVATATLAEALGGVTLDPVDKALLCQKAEHLFAGTPCGIMDQFAVIFGKPGHFLLIDCHSLKRVLVPFAAAGLSLLIVNTMIRHELASGEYARRRAECQEAARVFGVNQLRDVTPDDLEEKRELLSPLLFRRTRHVVTENARTLQAVDALQRGAEAELGELLYASHRSLRDDYEVSCAELDFVVVCAERIGLANGMIGCRMTGGGFGGCCVALVRSAASAQIAASIASEYQAHTGVVPEIIATAPSDGAQLLLKP